MSGRVSNPRSLLLRLPFASSGGRPTQAKCSARARRLQLCAGVLGASSSVRSDGSPHEGRQGRQPGGGGQGHEGREGAEDDDEAREEAVAQGAHVRDVPSPEDAAAREDAQVPAAERAQPQQAGPLRGAQVPADDGVGDEEDLGQQHAGVHRGRARGQEEDQGCGEEDVRHSDEEGEHADQAGRIEEGIRETDGRLRRAGCGEQDRHHLERCELLQFCDHYQSRDLAWFLYGFRLLSFRSFLIRTEEFAFFRLLLDS